MFTENTINLLYEELNILESRVSQLESNNTQRGGYFKSILEQVEKPKCCDPCGCTDDENPPQLISCDGATDNILFTEFTGMWSLYVDDSFVSVGTKYELLYDLNNLGYTVGTNPDKTGMYIKNNSGLNRRFRIAKWEPPIQPIVADNYPITLRFENLSGGSTNTGNYVWNTQLPTTLVSGLNYSDSGMKRSKHWAEVSRFAHFFKIDGVVIHNLNVELKIASAFGATYNLIKTLNPSGNRTDFSFITYVENSEAVGAIIENVGSYGLQYSFSIKPIDAEPNFAIATGNPTFLEHADGSLTFCLLHFL